jgi:hypothetical protein
MIRSDVRRRSADAASIAKRAGFWVRVVAFVIDVAVINVLIGVIGLAATGLTGGQVRVANTVLHFVDCTRLEASPRACAL